MNNNYIGMLFKDVFGLLQHIALVKNDVINGASQNQSADENITSLKQSRVGCIFKSIQFPLILHPVHVLIINRNQDLGIKNSCHYR